MTSSASLTAFDRGFAFASKHLPMLVFFGLVPAIVEIVSAYFIFENPVTSKQVYTMLIAGVSMKAWAIGAVAMFVLEHAAGRYPSVVSTSFRAFQYLPKVMLSYGLVVASLAILWPLLPLLVFLLWAPLYCAIETYATRIEEDEDEYIDEEELEADILSGAKKFPMFANKGLLELGMARSISFGGRNIRVTLLVAVLLWFVNVSPPALVSVIWKDSPLFYPQMVQIILASLADTFVIALAVTVLILRTPGEFRSELEPFSGSDAVRVLSSTRAATTLGANSYFMALLVFASVGSSWIFYNNLQTTRGWPESAKLEVKTIKVAESAILSTILLSDPERKFRWFNPSGFFIEFGEKSSQNKQGDLQTKPYVLKRYKVFDESGTELNADSFSPHTGQLRLEVEFDKPDDAPPSGPYHIGYQSMFGHSWPVYSGTY